MLIEFTVTNFRSFRESQTLSMVAGRQQDEIETNTFDPGLPGFGRFVRSAVVYGPNAAGKTNLLLALQFVQQLVLSSASELAASAPLPYLPFKFSRASRKAPTEFEVTFVQNKTRYVYGFSMDAVQIRDEWLTEYVNPRGRAIFERTYNSKSDKHEWKFSTFLKGQRSVWSEATRPNALFLSTAIQLNSKQLLPVFEWFQKRLVIITGVTTMNAALTLQLLGKPDGKDQLLPFLQKADLSIAGIDVKREIIPGTGAVMLSGSPIIEQRPGGARNVVKITLEHFADDKDLVGLDLSEESAGTQALFRTAGAWLNVFSNGEVLLFDELETSMHIMLVQFLIQKVHSNVSNPNNAQLIFSTHNVALLSSGLFRRDQIWFVEKDKNGASRLFPLTDFKPRSDEKIEKSYLRGSYGALPLLPDNPA
jgi:AAA15 family ATPase/GTPase